VILQGITTENITALFFIAVKTSHLIKIILTCLIWTPEHGKATFSLYHEGSVEANASQLGMEVHGGIEDVFGTCGTRNQSLICLQISKRTSNGEFNETCEHSLVR
jgi:hypothetical protein